MQVINLEEWRNKESGPAKEEKSLKWYIVTTAAMDSQGSSPLGSLSLHTTSQNCPPKGCPRQ